jgi:hypothetical protein
MKTFILFLFADFDDHEDIEFFCTEVFGMNPTINSLKYVIETNNNNIIIIFDSDLDDVTLSDELNEALRNENIKFYFIFERDSIVIAHLPKDVKDFIFKPFSESTMMLLDFHKPESMDLDQLLDKIEKMGVESLTPEEKNFLDNFEN